MIHYYQKNWGETMGDCLDRFRNHEQITQPVTYAGRLDPAADGIVLFLSGDDRYHKDNWLRTDKEYIVQILCGVATDTCDLLGIITDHITGDVMLPDTGHIIHTMEQITGTHSRPFPAYSSRRHEGKPLWHHARNNAVPEVAHSFTIQSIQLNAVDEIPAQNALNKVTDICTILSANNHDFRQTNILQSWSEHSTILPSTLPLLHLTVSCSSGTYMRQLAFDLGQSLGIPSLAYHITRTRITPALTAIDLQSNQ